MDGIIKINKQKGYTSHDVVSKMRKILHTKKIGHTGTLDPMAEGVLPILIGKATKIEKYLIEHNKTYVATIKLGEKRDTGDCEGNIVEKKEVPFFETQKIKDVLSTFIGKQEQIPPMYSAIKVNGKKLYEYARQGIKVELEPRKIEIYSIELINLDNIENQIVFKVSCSKGTYIRTLCEDISEKLDTIGYMKELNRIKVGEFSIENSIKIEELENQSEEFIENQLISIEDVFRKEKEIILNENKMNHFLNGVRIAYNLTDGVYRIYNTKKEFIGIGTIKEKLLKRDVIINEKN